MPTQPFNLGWRASFLQLYEQLIHKNPNVLTNFNDTASINTSGTGQVYGNQKSSD